MSVKYEISAEARDTKGSSASRHLRRNGKVPAVLYGAGKDVVMLSLDHNTLLHSLEHEAFHTSILTLKLGGNSEKAILRDVQMHPYKLRIIHIDFQRVSEAEKIHMRAPFHFEGDDVAPGVKLEGGIVSHLMTEIDITCLPKDLPEYLLVDISELALGQSVHISDLKLPEGVEITSLGHGGQDLAIVTIVAIRGSTEDEEEAAAASAEGEAAGEGEATEAAPEEDKKEES
jgi:large subunit ribosomal protein L25